MKNLVFSLLGVLFFNCIYAQQFAVFENNKKNKSLFDYNDPNSLVSMLLKNEDNIQDFFRESEGHFFTKSNSPQFVFGPATPMEISGIDRNIVLMKSGKTYEYWLDSLLHDSDVLHDDAGVSEYEQLGRMNAVFLKSAWEAAYEGGFLYNKPSLVGNYDLTNIDLIIVDSLDAYFGQKSLYENKHIICLKLPLYFLNSLYQIDYVPADVSKSIYEKLRSFQLMKKEQFKNDMDTGYELELYESNSYKGANQSFCYDEYTYSKLLKTNALKNVKAKELVIFRLASQDEWIVQKSGSSYEHWLDSLLNHPDILRDDTGFSDYDMLWVLHLNDSVFLKSAWEAAGDGMQIMDKDYIGNYWIEMPNYAMYLKRTFDPTFIDSLNNSLKPKFKTRFNSILITETLMDAINSRGIYDYDGKLEVPAVIMSFGEEYDQLSDEIYNLLENELKPYNVQEELAWMKTLKNRKGKYKTADEIKRMIHCIGIDDTGISFE